MKIKKMKPVRAWGGFINDMLHAWTDTDSGERTYGTFTSRRGALRAYEDVREVEIREVPKRRKAVRK